MAYNEATWLPRWVRYYGNQFGLANLTIIDDGSDDGSTKDLACNLIKIPKMPFNDEKRANFISDLQTAYLNYYDVVIFADVDEFLIPDPQKHRCLHSYCDALKLPAVTAVGLDVLNVESREALMNWSKPVLGQRRFVSFTSALSKTLITRTPIRWGTGFHRSKPGPSIDPNLYLFHMKYADLPLALSRQAVTRSMKWDETMIARKAGNHQRQSDDWLKTQMTVRTRGEPTEFEFSRLICEAWDKRNADERGLETVDTTIKGPLVNIPGRFFGIV
jgi:hypothetical protein